MTEKRYKCDDCGYEFETPGVMKESAGEYWGRPVFMEYQICPVCRCESFSDMSQCACDEWTTERFCSGCMETAKVMLVQLFDKLSNERGISYSQAVDLVTEALEELEG